MFCRLIARRASSTLSVANGIATISLENPPVNLLSRDVLRTLKHSFDTLPDRTDVEGVILTSGKNGIFTGGLDIFELYGRSDEQLREYWTMLQNMWISIYTCPLPGMVYPTSLFPIVLQGFPSNSRYV